MSTRIVLVEDHKMVRDSLRAVLASQPDMEVVAEAGDGRTAVETVGQQRPDVVVMDVVLPGLSGIEATRQIKAAGPGIKVVALSRHAERHLVAGMLQAGASAYVLKKGAFRELAPAIRAVVADQVYPSPGIAGPAPRKKVVSGSTFFSAGVKT